jgi:secreted trypsin-like serine protease
LGDYFYTDRNDIGIGTQSACSGDSGGPLFYNGRQYGIAARVLDRPLCDNEFLNPFTIYTKVSAHMKYFIEPLMKKYSKKQ